MDPGGRRRRRGAGRGRRPRRRPRRSTRSCALPVIGHLRFQLERFGPELRQYIVTSNDEERPFSRDQRRWVYASAKGENSYFGFGTDNDVENAEGYPVIKHRTFAGPGALTGRHGGENVPLPWPR